MVNYRERPDQYQLDGGDKQAFEVEPYANEILPFWRHTSADEAAESASALYELYQRYKESGDFVGMDMVHRFLRLGLNKARSHEPLPAAFDGAPLRPGPAAIFSKTYRMVDNDPDYQRLRAVHEQRLQPGN